MTEIGKDENAVELHPLDNAKRHLKELIAQAADVDLDDTTIADEMAKSLRGDSELATHTDAKFWCYKPGTGTYEIVQEVDLRNVLLDLQQVVRAGRSRIRISGRKAQNIVKTLADRLHNPTFFKEARKGVAVANGFLSFQHGPLELEEKSPVNRARLFVPLNYDESAETIAIDHFTNDAFVEPELIDLAFEFAGIALFGQGSTYQTACILIGSGANGKGVYTQLIERLIPPTMRSSISPIEWKNDYQRYKLDGSVLNTVGELPPLTYASWQHMKGIIAGDLTTARPVRGNQTELHPTALHIFSTNKLPMVSEVSEAIRRRFRIIRLPNSVPLESRRPNYAAEIFEQNGEGLLLRVVQGMQRVVARGRIANPEASQKEMKRWLNGADLISDFMITSLEVTRAPTDRIAVGVMFTAIVEYAKTKGYNPPTSMRELATELKSRGLEQTKSSTMYWVGVRLRNSRTAPSGEDWD